MAGVRVVRVHREGVPTDFFLGPLSDSFCSLPVPLLLRQKAVLLLRKHAKKDTKVTNYCIEVLVSIYLGYL